MAYCVAAWSQKQSFSVCRNKPQVFQTCEIFLLFPIYFINCYVTKLKKFMQTVKICDKNKENIWNKAFQSGQMKYSRMQTLFNFQGCIGRSTSPISTSWKTLIESGVVSIDKLHWRYLQHVCCWWMIKKFRKKLLRKLLYGSLLGQLLICQPGTFLAHLAVISLPYHELPTKWHPFGAFTNIAQVGWGSTMNV